MTWLRPKGVFVKEETDEIIELKKDVVAEGPGNLGIQFVESSKHFSVNEPIKISFKEFNEMIYTVEFFGRDLIDKFSI
uniref:hypothetical protein n=1 Tax=Roseivirga sp. TaxID=1964215 RepID=UPI0040483364